MDNKEWMKKYLGAEKGKGSSIFSGVVFIGLGLFFFMMNQMLGQGEIIFILFSIASIAFGAWMVFSALNKSGTNHWTDMMEREGRLQSALSDFLNAEEFFGGNLRLGNEWCFGKGCKVPTAYRDIIRVYQSIHKTNFAEDSRMLIAVTTSGTTKMLCNLPLGGSGDEELNGVLNVLLGINPNIRIGYQE